MRETDFPLTAIPADILEGAAEQLFQPVAIWENIWSTGKTTVEIIWRQFYDLDFEPDEWFRQTGHGQFVDLKDALEFERYLVESKQMNIFKTTLFPYLSGDMLKDKIVSLTIKGVTMEKLANGGRTEEKPVVYFAERSKGFILNKTCAKVLANHFGPETDAWIGKRISLYAEAGEWFGKTGWALRVSDRLPSQPKPTTDQKIEKEVLEAMADPAFDSQPFDYSTATEEDLWKDGYDYSVPESDIAFEEHNRRVMEAIASRNKESNPSEPDPTEVNAQVMADVMAYVSETPNLTWEKVFTPIVELFPEDWKSVKECIAHLNFAYNFPVEDYHARPKKMVSSEFAQQVVSWWLGTPEEEEE